MKKTNVFLCALILMLAITGKAEAGIFFDDFNDGNADGWWLGNSHHILSQLGNWRVENGALTQDEGGDNYIATVNNLLVSSQQIETQIKINPVSGYGGVTLWYQDSLNYIDFVLYPAAGAFNVYESINGSFEADVRNHFSFPYQASNGVWYNLRVDADSITKNLTVYLDGNYLFTYQASTPNNSGLSGVNDGNGGAFFDNFTLTSDDIAPVPEPATMLLFGTGLVGAFLKRRLV